MSEKNEESKADVHKAAGNEFFKNKKFDEAVAEYTKAIEADSENPVLYSNRSGAYCALKKYKEALADAEECISNKRAWGKGYGRKGDALFGMRQFDKAVQAYKDGLKFDPLAANLSTKIADCEKAAANAKPAGIPFLKRMILYVQICLHSLVMMTCILGSLPFLGQLHHVSFGMCVKLTLLVQTIAVFNNNGFIKFNKDYLRKVAFDEEAHYFFGSFLFLISQPNIMANLPQAIRSGFFIVSAFQILLPTMIPFLWDYISKYFLTITKMRSDVYSFCSSMEVMTVFVLMFELLTPARNVLLVLMYWQYLRLRFMLSPGTKSAFAGINQTLTRWSHASWVPSPVGSGYTRLANFIHSFVDPNQNRPEDNRWINKCSIM